jgi:HlyD family secretion protein
MAIARRHLGWAIGALVLASLAFGRLVAGRGDNGQTAPLVRVERRDLDVKIVEMGTLVAPKSVTIASEIQSNKAKVVRLNPEGSVVKRGDLLVEFDPAPFLEEVTKYTRAVKEAEANLLQARQEAKLQESKGAQLAQDTEMRVKMAELELETMEKGGAPLSAKEAKARVQQMRQELTRATESFADAEAFLKQGFITRKEYEEAAARFNDAKRADELAAAQYENLIRYRQPADLQRNRANLERARGDWARVQETGAEEQLRQKALLDKAEMAAEAARADLAKAQSDLDKAKLASPASGFLVYNEIPIGSEYRKIQIGDSVWQGQAIITIPDTSAMAVETFVREFDVHKVRPGQNARITLEAFPGVELPGAVDFIGNLATRRGAGQAEKEFSVRVILKETRPELRPGMTAQVHIEVETLPGALVVPVEAVYQEGGRYRCYLARGRGGVEREVQIGKSTEDYAVILAGLEEGDLVSLTPRRGRSWLWWR